MESWVGLCEHCTTGHKLPGTPVGSTLTVDGITTYFSPGTTPSENQKAVVIATDVFGLATGNPQLIADEIAKRIGVDVWVPDMFNGKPPMNADRIQPHQIDEPGKGDTRTWGQRLGYMGFLLSCVPAMIVNRPAVINAKVERFAKYIKNEKKYTKMGTVGYCLGGGVVAYLGTTDVFSSIVIAHPSPLSIDDIKKIKVPTSWICAEEDEWFKIRQEAEKAFAARKDGLLYEFRDYKGTVHGFGARPNLGVPVVKAAFLGSLEQIATWFTKTLELGA